VIMRRGDNAACRFKGGNKFLSLKEALGGAQGRGGGTRRKKESGKGVHTRSKKIADEPDHYPLEIKKRWERHIMVRARERKIEGNEIPGSLAYSDQICLLTY